MSEPLWFVIAYFVSAPLVAAALVFANWRWIRRLFAGDK